MSICGCGATDCAKCYPQNFEKGVCMVDLTCDACGRDWEADTMDEYETGLCPECRNPETEVVEVPCANANGALVTGLVEAVIE